MFVEMWTRTHREPRGGKWKRLEWTTDLQDFCFSLCAPHTLYCCRRCVDCDCGLDVLATPTHCRHPMRLSSQEYRKQEIACSFYFSLQHYQDSSPLAFLTIFFSFRRLLLHFLLLNCSASQFTKLTAARHYYTIFLLVESTFYTYIHNTNIPFYSNFRKFLARQHLKNYKNVHSNNN